VVVCTTDNLHAAVSAAAMKRGKHVFCQKPLTHTVYEARRIAEIARETGVATQIAVANQASEDTRRLCEWIWSGAVGPVREVHNWSSRPYWAQGIERPKVEEPVPKGLDWDLWLGPAPARPFNSVYVPFAWRGWADFGCGALGDMGSYSFDTIFRALKLEAPVSVEASSTERYEETYPLASIIQYNFGTRGEMPPVKFTWYDGGLKPPRPEELEENRPFKGEGEDEDEGLLFVGDRGKILCGFNGAHPKLIPEAKMSSYQQPPRTLPRSPGNEREWLDACKGGKVKPGGNFEFEGLVTGDFAAWKCCGSCRRENQLGPCRPEGDQQRYGAKVGPAATPERVGTLVSTSQGFSLRRGECLRCREERSSRVPPRRLPRQDLFPLEVQSLWPIHWGCRSDARPGR
jgi:predicted dehydrogenase